MREGDAGFIGAGINSLAAAFLLGKAGWRVLVAERNEQPGGAVRTMPLMLPGFHHDIGALQRARVAVCKTWCRVHQRRAILRLNRSRRSLLGHHHGSRRQLACHCSALPGRRASLADVERRLRSLRSDPVSRFQLSRRVWRTVAGSRLMSKAAIH